MCSKTKVQNEADKQSPDVYCVCCNIKIETIETRLKLQPFPPPEPPDALVVHLTAGTASQMGDAAIATLASQRDDVGCQPRFICSPARPLALCRTVLAEHLTNAALGNIKHLPDMVNTCPATRRAQ